MTSTAEHTPSKKFVNAAIESSEALEGAGTLLAMLEDKADNQQVTPSELAAVRCIVETCATNLNSVLDHID